MLTDKEKERRKKQVTETRSNQLTDEEERARRVSQIQQRRNELGLDSFKSKQQVEYDNQRQRYEKYVRSHAPTIQGSYIRKADGGIYHSSDANYAKNYYADMDTYKNNAVRIKELQSKKSSNKTTNGRNDGIRKSAMSDAEKKELDDLLKWQEEHSQYADYDFSGYTAPEQKTRKEQYDDAVSKITAYDNTTDDAEQYAFDRSNGDQDLYNFYYSGYLRSAGRTKDTDNEYQQAQNFKREYDRTDGIEGKYDYLMENADYEELSKYDATNFEKIKNNGGLKYDTDQLSDKEYAQMTYLYNTEGMDAVNKYLEDYSTILSKRKATAMQERISQDILGTQNEDGTYSGGAGFFKKAGYDALSVYQNVLSAPIALADQAISAASGNYNPYDGGNYGQMMSEAIRSARSTGIDETAKKLFNTDSSPAVLGIGFGEVYQALMSGIDSVVGATLMGTAYTYSMGAGAAASHARELYESGASGTQIMLASSAAGIAEALFEYVSLDHFLNLSDPKSIRELLKNSFLQGGVEASEEVFTEMANIISDYAILGANSDIYNNVQAEMQKGYSLQDAMAIVIGDQLYHAAAGGFISGGAMGVTGQSLGYAQNQYDYAKSGKAIRSESGAVDALRSLANEVTGYDTTNYDAVRDTERYAKQADKANSKQEQKKSAGKKNSGFSEWNANRKTGRLSAQVAENISNQNLSDIKSSLKENGMDSKSIDKAAETIAYIQETGATLRQAVSNEELYNEYKNSDAFNAALKATEKENTKRLSTYDLALSGVKVTYDSDGKVSKETQDAIVEKVKDKIVENMSNVTVSETGTAKVISDDSSIKITGISEIRNGSDGKQNIILNATTADGKTIQISDSEIEWGSAEQGYLYESFAALDLPTSSLNSYLSGFNARDYIGNGSSLAPVIQYASEFADAVIAGRIGIEAKTGSMNETARKTAHSFGTVLGKGDIEKYREKANRAKVNRGEKSSSVASNETTNSDGVIVEKDLQKRIDSDPNYFNEFQSTAYEVVKALADNGLRIHLYETVAESYTDSEGKKKIDFYRELSNGEVDKVDYNGYFTANNGDIYLDINGVSDTAGFYAFTMSHELTHFMRVFAPEQYQAYAKQLATWYGKKGQDIVKMVKDRASNEGLEYDVAFEEFVAESSETFLTDSDFGAKMAELKKTNKGLWETIKAKIREFIDLLKKTYEAATLSSEAGQFVRMNRDADVDELIAMWSDGIGLAIENYNDTANVNANGLTNEQIFNSDSNILEGKEMLPEQENTFSRKYDTEYMDRAVQYNDDKGGLVDSDVLDRARKDRAKIKKLMDDLQEQLSLPDDIEGNTFLDDKSYGGSEEQTTICPRSTSMEDLLDAVSEMVGRPLTVKECIGIQVRANEYMLEPECSYCYVATDRKSQREFLGRYLASRDKMLNNYVKGADISRNGNLYKEFLKDDSGKARKDTDNMWERFCLFIEAAEAGDLITPNELANFNNLTIFANEYAYKVDNGIDVTLHDKQIADALAYAQSASWAKKRIGYTAYNGHILDFKQDLINKLNSHYGLRMYSFSDYAPAYLLENMQQVTDASVRGLKMLGYTKSIDFARIMEPTGMNINISTFGFFKNGEVHENNLMGADWAKAKALREESIKNGTGVGITFVATDDKAVMWALKQDWIDVVIPFHLVRTGKQLADMLGYKDYKNVSSDKKGNKWKLPKKPNKNDLEAVAAYNEKYAKELEWVDSHSPSVSPVQHNNDYDTYLAALKENNLTSRFENYRKKVATGELTKQEFMKLVNECRVAANVGKPVQPIFNMEAAEFSIRTAGSYKQYVGGTQDAMLDIASKIEQEITAGTFVRDTSKTATERTGRQKVDDAIDAVSFNHSEIRNSTKVSRNYIGSDSNGDVLDMLNSTLTVSENIRRLSETNPKEFDEWLRKNAWNPITNPNGKYEITYRTMQVIDGNLYPPMATIDTNGKMGEHSNLFEWEAAVADREQEINNLLDSLANGRAVMRRKDVDYKPDGIISPMKKSDFAAAHGVKGKVLDSLFKEYSENIKSNNSRIYSEWATKENIDSLIAEGWYPHYKLVKRQGDEIYARYNPYLHSSNQILNDQFKGAYDRDNLQVIECVVPHSEGKDSTGKSAFFSEYAKDGTGWAEWKTGDVASQVSKNGGEERKVFLSRWLMPVRVLDSDEVATMYAGYLNGNKGIRIPANTVSPQLLAALERLVPENINYSLTAPSDKKPNGVFDGSYIDRLEKRIAKEKSPSVKKELQKKLDHAYDMDGIRYSNKNESHYFSNEGVNWAYKIGAIDDSDYSAFFEAIHNSVYMGSKGIARTVDGDYIIDTGRTLIITDGDYQMPLAKIVITFNDENETTREETKRVIRNEARRTGNIQTAIQTIENVCGYGYAVIYNSEDYLSNGWKDGRRERSYRSRNNEGYYQNAKSLKQRMLDDGYVYDEETESYYDHDGKKLFSSKNQLQADINNAEQIVETIDKIENSKISEEQDAALATLLRLARYSDVNRQQVLAVEAMGRELERTQKNLAAAKEDLAEAKANFDAKYETDTRIAAKKAEFETALANDKVIKQREARIAKLEQQIEDIKAKRDEKLKELRADRDDKLQNLRDQKKQRVDDVRENYRKREVRAKLAKVLKSFETRINKPGEARYIPDDLKSITIEFIQAINTDNDYWQKRIDSINKRLANTTDAKEIAELTKQLQEVTLKANEASNKLAELKARYDKLKTDASNFAVYDQTLSTMLGDLQQELNGVPVNKMTLAQLTKAYKTMKALDTVVRNSIKMVQSKIALDRFKLGEELIAELKDVKKTHGTVLDNYIETQMRPETMFDRLGGYKKNSYWSQMYRMLNDGQLKQTRLIMEFSSDFTPLLADKNFKSMQEMVDVGLKDEDGNTVQITRGMMLSLYMHLSNEDNARHVQGGGFTVPGTKRYYNGDRQMAYDQDGIRVRGYSAELKEPMHELSKAKHEMTEAAKELKAAIASGDSQKIADASIKAKNAKDAAEIAAQKVQNIRDQADIYIARVKMDIERKLTEYDRKWIHAVRVLNDVKSANALNETTKEMYGFEKATVQGYFPIVTDSNFLGASFDQVAMDMSLANVGFMEDRVQASNPILLEDIADVTARVIRSSAQYAAMLAPIQNFQKVYGTVEGGFETSVQAELGKKFAAGGKNYINNLMADLQGGRKVKDGKFSQVIGFLRGNTAGAALTLSATTAFAQVASYPTAAAELGYIPLLRALAKVDKMNGETGFVFARAEKEAIQKYSPLLWYRMQGYSTTEIGDLKTERNIASKVNQKMRGLTGWIQAMDGMTVGRLWYASQYYVEDNTDLQPGTDDFYKKTAEVFNNVVERTQPNYTTMQRPDLLRNPNALIKSFSMFYTQRLQNANITYDAAAKLIKYNSDLKAGKNGVTANDVRDQRNVLVRSVSSQIAATVTIVTTKAFVNALLHNMNSFRDDDGEITTESVFKTLLGQFSESMVSNMWLGSELYSFLKSMITGSRYYGVNVSGLDSLTDGLESMVNFRNAPSWSKAVSIGESIATIFGLPLKNAEKIAKGFYNHFVDAANGEFWSFEAGYDRTYKQNASRLLKAYIAGDEDLVKDITAEFDDDKKAMQYLNSHIKELYEEGDIDKETATEYLSKYSGKSDDDIYWLFDRWDSGLKSDEYEKYDDFYAAVETGTDLKNTIKRYTDNGVSTDTLKTNITNHYREVWLSASKSEQAKLKGYLRNAYKLLGADDDFLDKKITEWEFENKYGVDWTAEQVVKYQNEIKKYGVSIGLYDSFLKAKSAAKAGNKKDEVMKVINGMNISNAMKDALYRAAGFAESNISDAPWH